LHIYWLGWIYNTSLPNPYFQKLIYQPHIDVSNLDTPIISWFAK
jgi:hypothetical protein